MGGRLGIAVVLVGAVGGTAGGDAGPPNPCEVDMCPLAPFLAAPADGETEVATNAVVAVHEGDLRRCETVSYVLRDGNGVEIAATVEELAWATAFYPFPNSIRLRPLAPLAPSAQVSVFLRHSDGSEAVIGSFTTDALADGVRAAPPQSAAFSFSPNRAIACSEFSCCISSDSFGLELTITPADAEPVAFTIEDTHDGETFLVAADTPGAPSRGFLACEESGDNGSLLIGGPPPGSESLWSLRPGNHTFHVYARDRAGNESTPVVTSFLITCEGELTFFPDAGQFGDGGFREDDGGCACMLSEPSRGAGAPAAATILVVAGALLVLRRRR
jgi:hypothetical protein